MKFVLPPAVKCRQHTCRFPIRQGHLPLQNDFFYVLSSPAPSHIAALANMCRYLCTDNAYDAAEHLVTPQAHWFHP